MFRSKQKVKPKPAPKPTLSQLSGLDDFLGEMVAAEKQCVKDGKEGVRVALEYWQGMIKELKAIQRYLNK